MEAPLCRFCGTRHWSREPHDLPSAKARKAVEAVAPRLGKAPPAKGSKKTAAKPAGRKKAKGGRANADRPATKA